jgi:hypothetical protein
MRPVMHKLTSLLQVAWAAFLCIAVGMPWMFRDDRGAIAFTLFAIYLIAAIAAAGHSRIGWTIATAFAVLIVLYWSAVALLSIYWFATGDPDLREYPSGLLIALGSAALFTVPSITILMLAVIGYWQSKTT